MSAYDRTMSASDRVMLEQKEEITTLRARCAALEAALQWYADPKNWDDEGAAMDNVTGGYWSVDEYVDVDYDWDKGAHARAALASSSEKGRGDANPTNDDAPQAGG